MFRWSVRFKSLTTEERQTTACESVPVAEALRKVAELQKFPDVCSIRASAYKEGVYAGDITWTRNKKSGVWREVSNL